MDSEAQRIAPTHGGEVKPQPEYMPMEGEKPRPPSGQAQKGVRDGCETAVEGGGGRRVGLCPAMGS